WVSPVQVAVLVGLTIVLAVGLYTVAAQGTGPESATAPPTGSMTAAVGSRAWYAFNYPGDGTQILIRMSVSPQRSAGFSVWTQDSVRVWAAGGTENPVGRGSVNEALGGDLVWAGNFTVNGTYYVVVDQTGPDPASYTLQITGKSVSFPAMTAAVPSVTMMATQAVSTTSATTAATGTTVATTVAPTAMPIVTATPTGGGGPMDAMPIRGMAASLAVGGRTWYSFNYSGDGSAILIRMSVSPSLSAGFGVWTQDSVRVWAAGGTESPIGRGSVNDALGGDLVWAGSFTIPGTYYVVVDQSGTNIAYYTLQISGTGVSG
ncbi:MAG: hypothetical protein ACYC5O_15095, partial [Anaerolineae bacterium]